MVRDKVTRQRPQTTIFFEEKGEPKWNWAEALLLTGQLPYRLAKQADLTSQTHYSHWVTFQKLLLWVVIVIQSTRGRGGAEVVHGQTSPALLLPRPLGLSLMPRALWRHLGLRCQNLVLQAIQVPLALFNLFCQLPAKVSAIDGVRTGSVNEQQTANNWLCVV